MDIASPKGLSRGYPSLPPSVVSLSMFRFARNRDRIWALAQMQLARHALGRLPGLNFFRLLGAGTGEGFTPVPNVSVCAILTTWPSLEAAESQTGNSDIFRRYRARSVEDWSVHLSTLSAWGAWGGKMPFPQQGGPVDGPVAALTRATIRPRKMLKFWSRAPSISTAIGQNPDVLFKAGLGEVPWLHQMTFSIWPDTASMARFARKNGPHAEAIRDVRAGDWFSEELYARFRILSAYGQWEGRDPLAEYTLGLQQAAE